MSSPWQYQLVCDSSTYANFFAWASPISASLAASTWAQSNDTGQVMLSGMSLSAVTVSGSNATYTYAALTGLALAVGRALAITGMTHSQNNGTFVITALGSGTFTVLNASAVAESGSTGVVTQSSSVPGSGAFVYEIWTPNDGLTNFYLKVEYGNQSSSTNAPALRLTISSSTNGAGTATGFVSTAMVCGAGSFTPPSTTTPYECNFSGAAGRFGAEMWRNAPANSGQEIFAVERSVNSSGAYTSTYVTLYVGVSNTAPARAFNQATLVFGVGIAPSIYNTSSQGGLNTRVFQSNNGTTSAFNGSIPFDPASPMVGYWDYPGTVIGAVQPMDITEGVPFQVSLYGATRTYMPSKIGNLAFAGPGNTAGAVCLRYD